MYIKYINPKAKVTPLKNEIVAEAVGAMSKKIVALGGVFRGPLGITGGYEHA